MLKSAGDSGRDLLFTLRVGTDDALAAELKRFGDQVAKTQKQIWDGAAKAAEASLKKATSAASKAGTGGAGTAEIDRMTKARKAEDDKTLEQLKKVDAAYSKSMALRRSSVDATLRDLDRATKRHDAEAAKSAAALIRENERIVASARARAVRVKEARDREEAGRFGAARQSGSEAARDQDRAFLNNARSAETAAARIHAAQMNIKEGAYNAFEGIARLGRGFAYLGITGEKETQKILEMLLKVEASWNLARGGIDIYMGLTKAVGSYRTAVTAAAGVEAVAAVARLAVARQAANPFALSGSHAVMSAGGAAMAGGAAKVAGGGLISTAGAGLAAAIGGGLGATSAIGFGRDVSQYGFMGGSAPGSYNAKVGGWMASGMAMIPGTSGYQSDSMTERLQKQYQQDTAFRDRNSARGSINAQAMSARYGVDDWAGGVRGDVSNIRRSQSGLRANELFGQQRKMDALNRTIGLAGVRGSGVNAAGFSAAMMGADALRGQSLQSRLGGIGVDERSASHTTMLRLADDRRLAQRDFNDAGGDEERQAAAERIAQLDQQGAELARDRLRIEKEIADQKENAVRDAITGTTQELNLRRDMLREQQNALRSGAERFGGLSRSEQSRAIRTKSALNEADKLEQTGRVDEAEKIRRGISRRNLALVDQVGMGSDQEQSGSELERRGNRAGFAEAFGGEERNRVEGLQASVNRLNVAVKEQMNVNITLQRDNEKLVNDMSNRVEEKIKLANQELQAQLQEELDRRLGETNRNGNSNIIARQGAQR